MSNDPAPLIIFIADAGVDQNAKPLDFVTLDGSGSEGPEEITYSGKYIEIVPEENIYFQNKRTTNPTFVPSVNGN